MSLINEPFQASSIARANESGVSLQLQNGISSSFCKDGGSIIVDAAVPPVPSKLVERIKAAEFVDMAELLPECMGMFSTDEPSSKQKVRLHSVSSITEWVECFNVYLSVICRTCPEKIPELLAYQMLIKEANMVYYEGNS